MPELPRFRMKIVIIVLVLLVLMVTVGWLYLLASLPKTIGTVSVAGLDGQVEIVRDKNGRRCAGGMLNTFLKVISSE